MVESKNLESVQEGFIVYLGLGSNLNQPINQLISALALLNQSKHIELINCSSIYQTPPFDYSNQPDYYNLTLKIRTNMQPIELLNYLKLIERNQGRKSIKKWSARIIDIDILLFNNSIFNHPNLTIPHQSLAVRNFFLKPLLEITPVDFDYQGIGILKKHLEKIKSPIKKVKSAEQTNQYLKEKF